VSSRAMQFKAEIRNMAKGSGVSAQAVLQNFMLERFLERISLSPYKENLVLKGGMLIASLVGTAFRTTMDMDTTLRARSLDQATIQKMLEEICALALDDEVRFEFVRLEEIREDDSYGGYRAALIAHFDSIRTPVKIDLTTGDKLTPGAILYQYPSGFEEKTLEIWAYNLETVLAEKVETILRRSTLNTRARDFYDVYLLTKTQGENLDKALLREALDATIAHRESPVVLTKNRETLQAILADKGMQARWQRYAGMFSYARGIEFREIIDVLLMLLQDIQ
jgi:predicted nucleotidyltransferase component of viral defense system